MMKTETIEQAIDIIVNQFAISQESSNSIKDGLTELCRLKYMIWQNSERETETQRFITHIMISGRRFKFSGIINFITGDITLQAEEMNWDDFDRSVMFSLNLNNFIYDRLIQNQI